MIGFVGNAKNGDVEVGGVFDTSGGVWDSDFEIVDLDVAGTFGTITGERIAGAGLNKGSIFKWILITLINYNVYPCDLPEQ